MRRAMITIIILLCLAGTAVAGPLQDAYSAYAGGDYATAARLFRPLADRGDAYAQTFLGIMYGKGHGVPQDYGEAVRWYRKAAEQDYAIAQSNLGVMYNTGQGVAQDHTEAVTWFHKAAEQGHARAQLNLGVMYANAEGVPQDFVQAYKWFELASQFSTSQKERRDLAVRLRDRVAAKMTPAQIAEAQKLAREWKPK